MKKRSSIVLLVIGLWCGVAYAQPVFFDDFDGPDLLPHWNMFPPPRWEYEVSGGMLHVTDLFSPSTPHTGGNFAVIGAFYEPQMDFRMDVWMGWERTPAPEDELFVSVVGPFGGIMAEFGLRDLGGPAPVVAATSGAGHVSAPPPPPGLYQFTIARTGSQFDYYLDGEHFASLPDRGEITPAGGVHLFFAKPFPGEMNPYHVDRVRVVPGPATLGAGAIAAVGCSRRSRRAGVVQGDTR